MFAPPTIPRNGERTQNEGRAARRCEKRSVALMGRGVWSQLKENCARHWAPLYVTPKAGTCAERHILHASDEGRGPHQDPGYLALAATPLAGRLPLR
jgi:hypothetical protein